ncbi:uncharacterized protein LOC111618113 [Centruroides sculpturatus]|uniref:uncharacterized protein LOC111618113 n=1 Tax=Centruroides sculpturatus TaxID=218467 RepID=UPI000C6ECCEB|nr:uncharacterized protein LOC111618113 [Centruroides sculpturatus]
MGDKNNEKVSFSLFKKIRNTLDSIRHHREQIQRRQSRMSNRSLEHFMHCNNCNKLMEDYLENSDEGKKHEHLRKSLVQIPNKTKCPSSVEDFFDILPISTIDNTLCRRNENYPRCSTCLDDKEKYSFLDSKISERSIHSENNDKIATNEEGDEDDNDV